MQEIYPKRLSSNCKTDSLNAPTELAAASSTTSSSTVLDWTAPNDNAQDVVGYNVYNGDELEYATTGTETTYTVTGLLLAQTTLYSEIKR
jgi:hypothetical protein